MLGGFLALLLAHECLALTLHTSSVCLVLPQVALISHKNHLSFFHVLADLEEVKSRKRCCAISVALFLIIFSVFYLPPLLPTSGRTSLSSLYSLALLFMDLGVPLLDYVIERGLGVDTVH